MEETNIKIAHKCMGRLRLRCTLSDLSVQKKKQLAQSIMMVEGVRSVAINSITGSILVLHDANPLDIIDRIIDTVHFFLPPIEEKDAHGETTSETIVKRLVLSGASLLIHNIFLKRVFPGFRILGTLMNLPGIVSLVLTMPLLNSAKEGWIKTKRPNADFLTITSIIASLFLGNSNSALTIVMLSDIASFMTTYTIERTRKSIKKLLSVEDDYAWLVKENGELERTLTNNVKIDDCVVVHTGEKVTVDGVVVSGTALVDQSSTTGEFLPVMCKEGTAVFAGSIVKSGVMTVRTLKVGDDTVVSRIVNMVENVTTHKAPIQHYADHFSNYLAPLNFIIAAAVYLITKNAQKALKMLVIDYSCGIKLSTATAFSAAIHAGIRQGILIKGGAYLEKLSQANTFIFDKTGTITEGVPQITQALVTDSTKDEDYLVAIACATEETSMHPLAGAVLAYGKQKNVTIPTHGEIQTIVSRGTQTKVGNQQVRVGNSSFMRENNVKITEEAMQFAKKGIALYVAVNKKLIGVLIAEDHPRANIRRTFNQLRNKGIDEIAIMTGDTTEQARFIAKRVGADSYEGDLLPKDKAEAVRTFQEQGHHVVMVGDGINDAPALAYADVGISLGSKSTDVAMETSDIIIGRNDPMLIAKIRTISEKTMSIVKQNFSLVIVINTLGLICGATSNISVFLSAMLHNTSTIIVVANSFRLLFDREEGSK